MADEVNEGLLVIFELPGVKVHKIRQVFRSEWQVGTIIFVGLGIIRREIFLEIFLKTFLEFFIGKDLRHLVHRIKSKIEVLLETQAESDVRSTNTHAHAKDLIEIKIRIRSSCIVQDPLVTCVARVDVYVDADAGVVAMHINSLVYFRTSSRSARPALQNPPVPLAGRPHSLIDS
jgi:hypothetical protein